MKNFAFLLFFSSSLVFSQEIQLVNAVPSDFGKTQRTNEEKLASQAISLVVKENGLANALSLAYTNLGSGNNWYRLYDNYSIYGVNVSTKQYLGGWPLGASDPCENSANPDCVSSWWVGRWGADEVLESEVTQRITSHVLNQKFGLPYQLEPNSTLGCFANNPLRYGDIEGDGKQELVLMTQDSFIVFSPELKKTIFAFMFDNKDWVSWEWLIEQGLLLENTPDSPQFGSLKLAEENKGTDIGYRGQAKVFNGKFESETSTDLIVWRKFYQSRLKKDPIKGFEKVRDTFIHYKLVDGEYKKQETEQGVIKGWLEAKNLTWQKGYPSKSECPGHEGQLIPEMHDPLLNDPDVLK